MEPISLGVAAVAAVATRQVARKKLAAKKMAWLESFIPAAKIACAEYGVPPQICVAQAALESGWGAKAGGYNYFGIKGTGTAGSSSFASTEYIGGQKDQKVTKVSKFAKFKNMEDGIRAYCVLLTSNKLFKPASKLYPNDPGRFITWLWGKSYASGPNYPGMIISVMGTIYRATGDETYNVKMDPALKAIISKLQKTTMGSARWAQTDKLLNPEGTTFAGTTEARGVLAGMSGGHFAPSYNVPGSGYLNGGNFVPGYDVPGQGYLSGSKFSPYTIPGSGLANLRGGHFVPSYNVPGSASMSGLGAVVDPDAELSAPQEKESSLEDVNPLWWILPALAVGVSIEVYLHYRKKAKTV